ncbi:MAG: hypothetical protein V4584_07700 [Verrucomicrobiota bacterium]
MNSKSLITIAFTVIAIIFAVFAGVAILMNPTGGIAGVSKLVTVICAIFAFVSPRKGLFVLAAQAIYTDELKRVGVYYGAVSMETVQEILIGPLLTLCALNCGFLIQVMFGRVKMTKLGWALFSIAPILGLYYLSGGGIGGGDSFMKRAYNAGTAGLYTTVIPLSFALFRELKDWIKFLTVQTILVIPSAGWAIWQYFNGFNNMEWTYARSGLSPVHSAQMLEFIEPRVFGFFGSASALGCLSVYFAFAAWRTYAIRSWRWLFLLFSAILFAGIIVSTQRGTLILPFLFAGAMYCAFSKLRTVAFYGILGTIFLVGVWQSTWLLDEGIDKANAVVASDSKWGSEVLTFGTFSDRLRGWERLKRPQSWSLFGTEAELKSSISNVSISSDDYNHDMINRILMRTGAIGLGTVVILGCLLALTLHRTVWRLPNGEARSAGAFALGVTIPLLLSSAAGGDNFTATPYNLAIWSVFGGVFLLKKLQDNHLKQLSNPQPVTVRSEPTLNHTLRPAAD